MAKIIKFDTEARSKMLTGVNTLANDYYHTNASGTSTFFRITNNTGFVALLEACGTP